MRKTRGRNTPAPAVPAERVDRLVSTVPTETYKGVPVRRPKERLMSPVGLHMAAERAREERKAKTLAEKKAAAIAGPIHEPLHRTLSRESHVRWAREAAARKRRIAEKKGAGDVSDE
jgi:hypothetical protein